jgi:hypothetical protein
MPGTVIATREMIGSFREAVARMTEVPADDRQGFLWLPSRTATHDDVQAGIPALRQVELGGSVMAPALPDRCGSPPGTWNAAFIPGPRRRCCASTAHPWPC